MSLYSPASPRPTPFSGRPNPGCSRHCCRIHTGHAQTERQRVQQPQRPRCLVLSSLHPTNSPATNSLTAHLLPRQLRRQGHRSRVQPIQFSICHPPPSTHLPALTSTKCQLSRYSTQSLPPLNTAPSISLSIPVLLRSNPHHKIDFPDPRLYPLGTLFSSNQCY